ncbi:cation:proton antiporter [Arenibaculum sp.]|uniref:cation:proton antiporter n=1 Tax=Arenibaculum sp. TaxID=2865862 RepID=UPI002E11CB05|nr:cation:proton antiporter [Arenibaculum sp.]
MYDVGIVLLVIASLLGAVGVLQPIASRLRLPHSVLLAAFGVAIGIASALAPHVASGLAPHSDALPLFELARSFGDLPIGSAVFIQVFLPLLLFQAALTIDVRRMIEDAAPILLLAVVGVFVATGIIGFGLAPLADVPLVACLLLGAIVATTDPAAVVAIFRDLGAPARLTRLVEGESLLNDAAAIALFGVLLAMLADGSGADPASGLIGLATGFAGGFGGGLVFGIAAGRLAVLMLRPLRELRPAVFALSLSLPYLAFAGAERLFGVSGVVAVVAAGLTMSASGRAYVAPASWTSLQLAWEHVAFLAGSLVFVLASILVPKLLVDVDAGDLLLLAVLFAAALAARIVLLFGLLPILTLAGLGERVSGPYKLVITWGGLRGAVTLALALSVTENAAIDPAVQRFVAVLATGFVLATLFVNGVTLRPLIRLLGLHRLSALDLALRRQVLALSLTEVRDGIADSARAYGITPATAHAVLRDYEARIGEVTSGEGVEEAISDRDRLTLGLIALANRERELVLDHHAQRTVADDVIDLMLRHAGRVFDGARTGGRIGYNRAARRGLDFPPGFHVAYRLHRWLRIDRPLVRQLSTRFELLLVRRLVLDELKRFNAERLTSLLGARVADLLEEVLDGRIERTAKALDALRLQYPEHAEALKQRFLRQSALRQELARYRQLHEEGLIGQELHHDLVRELNQADRAADRRPRLDIRLDSAAMIRQVDLFADLDEADRSRLAKLFKPRFAVPGERIIRKGDRGDSVFFISSGAVEVLLPDRRIRLGRGDVVGEMALLTGARRQADVVALGFCHLLVLKRGDFHRFLRDNPEARARIDGIVEARLRMNDEAQTGIRTRATG